MSEESPRDCGSGYAPAKHAEEPAKVDQRGLEVNSIDWTMFHTQEDRGAVLEGPAFCERDDAWLGSAWYFWDDERDAVRWGQDAKDGKFRVYCARIVSEKVLNAVFNEEHYRFLMQALERVAKKIYEDTGRKATKKHLCRYFERAGWMREIDVLVVCDNPEGWREDLPIPLRRRIQAAVYNKACIREFRLHRQVG